MEYGKSVEEKVYKKYITHGINENVRVIDVVKKEATDGSWKAFDVIFSNGEGELNHRVFKFTYRPAATNAKREIMSEKDQGIEYLKAIKHIFSKVVGSTEKYDALISKVVGTTEDEQFDSFITVLKSMSGTTSNPFRLLCIDNGKGYAKVPGWSNGFCEAMEIIPSKLTFNEAKYGKKKPENTEAVIKPSEDTLPF